MDLAALQAECGRLLGDPNHDRWPLDVLTTRINIAQSEIGVYAKHWIGNSVHSLTSGSPSVSFGTPSLVVDVIEVTIQRVSGDVVPMVPITLFELDYRYPNWRQWTDGEPRLYYPDYSSGRIIVAPSPDDANAALTTPVTIRSARRFSDLTASDDIPFAETEFFTPFHIAIAHWTVAQCWMDDGTPEALAKAQYHKSGNLDRPGQYETHIKQLMARSDRPTDTLAGILWRPEGGRLGSWGTSKSFPLSY